MIEKRNNADWREKERRRLLTEEEFHRLIETGKVFEGDRRSWQERRKGPQGTKTKLELLQEFNISKLRL